MLKQLCLKQNAATRPMRSQRRRRRKFKTDTNLVYCGQYCWKHKNSIIERNLFLSDPPPIRNAEITQRFSTILRFQFTIPLTNFDKILVNYRTADGSTAWKKASETTVNKTTRVGEVRGSSWQWMKLYDLNEKNEIFLWLSFYLQLQIWCKSSIVYLF